MADGHRSDLIPLGVGHPVSSLYALNFSGSTFLPPRPLRLAPRPPRPREDPLPLPVLLCRKLMWLPSPTSPELRGAAAILGMR